MQNSQGSNPPGVFGIWEKRPETQKIEDQNTRQDKTTFHFAPLFKLINANIIPDSILFLIKHLI